jgi:hypothetical protein
MRDWRGIRAEIGDRVFYATADGAREPKLHEAWVEEVGETHIVCDQPPARSVE